VTSPLKTRFRLLGRLLATAPLAIMLLAGALPAGAHAQDAVNSRWGAYLAGRIAAVGRDMGAASNFYAQALRADSRPISPPGG